VNEAGVYQLGSLLAIGALTMNAHLTHSLLLAAPDSESRITINAPPQHEVIRRFLEQISSEVLHRLEEKAGLSLRQSVTVSIAPSEEEMDRVAPSEFRWPRWAIGFAFGDRNQVILRTTDLDSLGNQGVLQVFTHEMAHILLHQINSQPIPRWFNEGLALWVANAWAFEDTYTYSYLLLTEGYIPLQELSTSFPASEQRARMAYMESLFFLSSLVDSYGAEVVPTIVKGLDAGRSFEEAFQQATGLTSWEVEARWRRRVQFLYKWVPFLSSSAFLWMLITALVTLGYLKKKRRARAMIQRWEEDERLQSAPGMKERME